VVALGRHIGLPLRDAAFSNQNEVTENRLLSSDFCLPTSVFRLLSSDFCLQTSVFRLLSSDWDSKEIGVFFGLSLPPIRPEPR